MIDLHYKEQEVKEYLDKTIVCTTMNREDLYNIFHLGVIWEAIQREIPEQKYVLDYVENQFN